MSHIKHLRDTCTRTLGMCRTHTSEMFQKCFSRFESGQRDIDEACTW